MTRAEPGIASRSEERTYETTGEVGTQASNEVFRIAIAEELPVSRREYELSKREEELLERELRLERKEIEMSSTSITATVTLRTKVKMVAAMLNEFSREEDEYLTKWKTQTELLMGTYNLDENLMKLIIVRNTVDNFHLYRWRKITDDGRERKKEKGSKVGYL